MLYVPFILHIDVLWMKYKMKSMINHQMFVYSFPQPVITDTQPNPLKPLRSEWLDHVEGRPQASWLRQVESNLKDMDMTGLASALAMARRRLKEYRRKVDAATRCSGVCPHT